MSARNRELVNLVLVGVLGTAAFGSAWIAQTNRVSAEGLVNVAVIAALYLAAHVVVRMNGAPCRPDASATRRAADGNRAGDQLPARSSGRKEAGNLGRGRRPRALPSRSMRVAVRLPGAGAVPVPVRGLGDRTAAAAVRPRTSDSASTACASGSRSAASSFSRASSPSSSSSSSWPGTSARSGRCSPRAGSRIFGPLLAIWGAAMLVLSADERPRQRAPLLRCLPRHGLRRHRPARVRRSAAAFSSSQARLLCTRRSPASSERVTIWLHPWTDDRIYCPLNGTFDYRQNCQSYQLVKSLYSIAHGGYGGTGHRARDDDHPRREHR